MLSNLPDGTTEADIDYIFGNGEGEIMCSCCERRLEDGEAYWDFDDWIYCVDCLDSIKQYA